VVVVGHTFVQINHDMRLRARVQYALEQTRPLRESVARFALQHGRLPGGVAELEGGERKDYPEGGYFFLDGLSRVQVRFTVLPELVRGTLVLVPTIGEGGVIWDCLARGDIAPGHLPAECRR
jgi:hypothetical protein